MIRTQIQLDDDSFALLREHAQKSRRSMADCVREALGAYLRKELPTGPDIADMAGRFRPLPLLDVKHHDRYWAESLPRPRRKS